MLVQDREQAHPSVLQHPATLARLANYSIRGAFEAGQIPASMRDFHLETHRRDIFPAKAVNFSAVKHKLNLRPTRWLQRSKTTHSTGAGLETACGLRSIRAGLEPETKRFIQGAAMHISCRVVDSHGIRIVGGQDRIRMKLHDRWVEPDRPSRDFS